ncbi:TlpA disulfide reductase family protein [Chitinibacter tainanensis]|uniref:TlpA disulfide reductase family protein n=1 Tax=Chitinibacter tainanensis TaxID=230667 RepID=UPI002354812D|nr:TlpA disulfide reductase family protein [Chitinibacter tainanensis]
MKKPLLLAAIAASCIALGSYFVLGNQQTLPNQHAMQTLEGKSFKLDDYKGKVVLVNFWATSCTGCMKEMPELKKIQLKYGHERLQTIAVAMSYDNLQYIENYYQRTQLPFNVVYDANGEIAKQFGSIQLTPTNFLIGRDGKLIKKYIGEPDYAEIQRAIES